MEQQGSAKQGVRYGESAAMAIINAELEKRARENWECNVRSWAPKVTTNVGEGDTVVFVASLPFREVFVEGGTKDEALGGLLREYCRLGRVGSIDPACPEKRGMPPIQHVLGLLEEQLQREVRNRRDLIEMRQNAGCATPVDDPYTELLEDPPFKRQNDVIAALGTAIAALARVREA